MKRLRGIRLHCFLCSHITTFQSARFRTLIRFTWRWIYQIDAYEQGKQKNWSIYMFIFTYTVSTYRFKLMYSDRLVAKNMGSTSQQSDVGEPQVRATSFTWTWTRSSFGPFCILLLPVYNILISLLVMYVPYLITLLFSSLMEQYAVCLFIQFLLLQHVGLSRHLRPPPSPPPPIHEIRIPSSCLFSTARLRISLQSSREWALPFLCYSAYLALSQELYRIRRNWGRRHRPDICLFKAIHY